MKKYIFALISLMLLFFSTNALAARGVIEILDADSTHQGYAVKLQFPSQTSFTDNGQRNIGFDLSSVAAGGWTVDGANDIIYVTDANNSVKVAGDGPPNIILDNTTISADADSGYFIWRGNDGGADTELDMSIKLDVTTTTDYWLAFYNDGQGTEVGTIDQSGNLQLDGVLTVSGGDLVLGTSSVAGTIAMHDAGALTVYEDGDNFSASFNCKDGAAEFQFNDDVNLGTSSDAENLYIHNAGTLNLYEAGDSFSVSANCKDGAGEWVFNDDVNIGTSASGKNLTIVSTEGTELVITNPTFDSDLTGWTGGADWTWDATGKALHTAGAANTFYPTVSIVVVVGNVYKVAFTVSSYSAGSITMTLGGVLGTVRAENGTFTSYIKATTTGNLIFSPTSTFGGMLDDISIKQITEGTLSVEGANTFAGRTILESGSATYPAMVFSNDASSVGWFRYGATSMGYATDAATRQVFTPSTHWINSDAATISMGTTAPDAWFRRSGADSFAFGNVDAAAPAAQTISVQNVVAGTSNTAGADFTISGSQGTGTGAGGSIIFKTAAAGGAGSTQNALATALTIDSTKLATFAGDATVSDGDLILGTSSVAGTIAMHDAGTITMYDDGDNTNAVIGPVADGTDDLGLTGDLVVSKTISANGAVLTGDTNTFDITSGTGSLNVAAGKTVDFDMDFKVDGTGTTITGVTQANTLTLNESFTIGDGYNVSITAEDVAGSIVLDEQTFEVEGEGTATQLTKLVNANNAAATLTIEGTSAVVNQDTTSDATVTFGTVNGLTITDTANTIDIDKGTAGLDIAPAATVNIDKSLTIDGQATTITGVTQANTLTLNESLTIGDGANVTLTAEDTAGSITLDEQTFEVEGEGTATRLFKLVNAEDAARTLTFNENITIGDGYPITFTAEDAISSITLDEQTFEVEGEGTATQLMKLVNANNAAATLTIEGTSAVVNQDTTSDGSPSFTKVTTTEIDFAGNITLDPTVDGASYVDIANSGTGAAKLYIEGDQINSDDLSDVASIGMLDEAETVSGAWVFSNQTTALTIGDGTDTVDFRILANGHFADGSITYMEDEDRWDFDNDVTIGGEFIASGTGPHAFGDTTYGYSQIKFGGNFTGDGADAHAEKILIQGTLTGYDGDTQRLAIMDCMGGITTQNGSDTIGVVAQAIFRDPTISKGATDTITDAATVYIEAAPDEGGTRNAALLVDAGATILDDLLDIGGDLYLDTTKKVILADDADDHTYFLESGADVFDLYVGGVNAIKATESTTISGVLTDAWDVTGALTAGTVASDGYVTAVGSATVTQDAIGVTRSDANGIRIANTTAAAAGAQQMSPPLVFQGQGWKTDATAASQKVEFAIDMTPVQDAAAPTGRLDVVASIADGAYSTTPIMSLLSGGNVGIGTKAPNCNLEIYADTVANLYLRRSNTGDAPNGVIYFNGNSSGSVTYGSSIQGYDGSLRFFADSTPRDASNDLTQMAIITNTGDVGIGATSPDGPFHVEEDNAATAAAVEVMRASLTSTGTPAVGLGPAIVGEVETVAGAPGNQEEIGSVDFIVTDVGSGTEDGAIVFKSMTGGATMTEKMRIGADNVNVSAPFFEKYTITTDNTDGAATHTAAELLGKHIRRGTGDEITAARTDVTDTAANIVAAMNGCVDGNGFEFTIANEDSTHTVALDGGAGVTIIPNDPSTAIPANSTGRFRLVVTDATLSSEAIDIHCLGYSTH